MKRRQKKRTQLSKLKLLDNHFTIDLCESSATQIYEYGMKMRCTLSLVTKLCD